MSWTQERIELLRKLWSEGLSASQIAARLGDVTRNAVIGKVHRLGLEGRTRIGSETARFASEGGLAEAAAGVPPEPRPPVPAASGQAAVEAVALAETGKVTLLHLTEQTCKWPIGDPGTPSFHFCGQRAELGLPYCATHARIAYQPTQDRRRDRRLAGL